jgi:hypothetical protein
LIWRLAAAELGTGEADFTVVFVHRFQRAVFGVAELPR